MTSIHSYLREIDEAEKAHDLEEALATRAFMARTRERIEMGIPVSDHDRAIWRANLLAEQAQAAKFCTCDAPFGADGRCLANPLHVTRDQRLARF